MYAKKLHFKRLEKNCQFNVKKVALLTISGKQNSNICEHIIQ